MGEFWTVASIEVTANRQISFFALKAHFVFKEMSAGLGLYIAPIYPVSVILLSRIQPLDY